MIMLQQTMNKVSKAFMNLNYMKLRLKLKEIRIKEVLDDVKISKGRIVGRVDGHVIYDPFASLVDGFQRNV